MACSRHFLLLSILCFFLFLNVLQHFHPSSSIIAYAEEEEEYYEDEEETVVGVPAASQSNKPPPADSSGGNEEDEYYDEYYEDEEESPSQTASAGVQMNSEPAEPKVRGPEYNGFIRHEGGGLMKITQLLATETFLNKTIDYYECIRREQAFILMLEQPIEEKKDEVGFQELTNQVNSLRQKMERTVKQTMGGNQEEESAATMAAAVAAEAEAIKNNITADGTTTERDGKNKRTSFRERQAIKIKERRERIAQRELVRPKFRLGLDCESLICSSCKSIVEEFGDAIHRSITDPKMRYVDQVFEGFCDSKFIKIKYDDVVFDICKNFEEETLGYKEAMIAAFEEDGDWPNINSAKSLAMKKERVCVAVGACTSDQFEFQTEPLYEQQEHWDDKCFTCQAFASELEQKAQITRHVTESSIVPIVSSTCGRLVSLSFDSFICFFRMN